MREGGNWHTVCARHVRGGSGKSRMWTGQREHRQDTPHTRTHMQTKTRRGARVLLPRAESAVLSLLPACRSARAGRTGSSLSLATPPRSDMLCFQPLVQAFVVECVGCV